MAKKKKVSTFNDSFDFNKLLTIIKRTFVFYVLIGAIAMVGAFLYLRYTPQTFQAYSIIQINEEKNNDILKVDNVYGKTSLNNLIELIRSQEFLKRSLQKLNLYTTYFQEGKFLTSELYNKTPFFVEYKDVQPIFYNKNIYVQYNKKTDSLIISYELERDKEIHHTLKRNTWTQIHGAEIYINITNLAQLSEGKGGKYFFKILNDSGAFAEHIAGLQVSILNYDAKTIQIYHSGSNAQKSSDIVNTISEDFLTFNVEKKQERAEKVLEFIEEQMDVVYEKLNESEKQLNAFKRNYNITQNILGDKSAIKSILSDNAKDIERKEKQLASLKNVNSKIQNNEDFNAMEFIALLSGSSNESMILNFLNGIQQLQKEKDYLLISVTPDNHKVKIIDQQILEQKKLLSEFIKITNDKILAELGASQTLEKKEKNIEIDEIELAKLNRVHSINQNYYDQLVTKRAEFLISKAGHITDNLILQKSSVPTSPIAPIPTHIMMIAIILAGIFIFLITLVRYALYNDITNTQDISNYTAIPIAGAIPISLQTNKINRFVIENKANSIITEAFRTLRSNLDFMHHVSKDKRIIAITSTISGEGKTFIAINLGGVLAMSGKRVILIDLDLRKPKVHLTFKAKNDKGISTILIGKNSYKDCIIKTEFDNFDVITSGPPPPNPSELANSDMFDSLLQQLKTQYDVIIIDTPPIGIISDAMFSFRRADLPIYVARANYSKRNFINNINFISEQKNIHNLSIVLNAVELKHKKYGYKQYGYGYGYGYGYYSQESDLDSPKEKHSFFKKHNKHAPNDV